MTNTALNSAKNPVARKILDFQDARHSNNKESVSHLAQQALAEAKYASIGDLGAESTGTMFPDSHLPPQLDPKDVASIANATGMDPRHLGFAQAMAKGDRVGALAATELQPRHTDALVSLVNGDYSGALAATGIDPRVSSAGNALMKGDYLGALAAAGLDPRLANAGKSIMSGDYLGGLAAAGVDPRAVSAAKAMIGGDPLGAIANATGVDPQTLSMAKSLMKGDVLGALSDKTGLPLDQAAKFLKSPGSAAKSAIAGGGGLGGGGAAKKTSASKKKDKSGVNIPLGGGGQSDKGKSSGAKKGKSADGNVSDDKADSTESIDDTDITEETGQCRCTDEGGTNDAGAVVPKNSETESRCCPISVVSGEELLEHTDFSIGNIIPFHWVRTYRSSATDNKGMGYGWSFPLAESICLADRNILLKDSEGRNIPFPFVGAGDSSENRTEKLILHRKDKHTIVLWSSLHPSSPHKHFIFDQNTQRFQLSSIEDLHGNAWHCIYDEGRVQYLHSTWGEGLAFEYRDGLIHSISRYLERTSENSDDVGIANDIVTDSVKTLVEYRYDPEQDMVEAIDAQGNSEKYAFQNHIIIQRTLKTGYRYYFQWDTQDNTGKCLRNWGDSIDGVTTYDYRFDYNEVSRCTRVTDTRGGIETLYYNERGQVTEIIDPMGYKTQTRYSAQGEITELVGPAGERTSYSYDEMQRRISTTDVLGNISQTTYNALGKVEISTDATGLSTHYQYNDQGLLTSRIYPDGQVQYLSYSDRGQLVKLYQEGSPTIHYRWNDYGQLERQEIELANNTLLEHLSYDAEGRVSEHRDANGKTTQYHYYPNNQIRSITSPDGHTQSYEYNPDGLITRYTDADGKCTRYEYAGLQQPIRRIDAGGNSLLYEYDGERNLIALHNENNDVYRFEYDLNENVIRETTFDGRIMMHQYNASGHKIKTREYTKGQLEAIQSIEYRRDRSGRLIEQYNSDEDYLIFTYKNNLLVSADNGKCALQFGYDVLGRLIYEQQGEHKIYHHYDAQGRLESSQLPDQQTLSYGYGNFSTEVLFSGRKISESLFNPLGQETERRYGDMVDTRHYDNLGRLSQHQVSHSKTKSVLFHRQYDFNSANGLLQKTTDTDLKTTHYSYDVKHQLSSVRGLREESFDYDPAGNLLSHSRDKRNSIEGNRIDRQSDAFFSYDKQGNLVEERHGSPATKRVLYSYNGFNQLTKIEKHKIEKNKKKTVASVSYEYDPLGRRISKTDSTGRTDFLWRGDQLISERRNNNIGKGGKAENKTFIYEPNSFVPLALIQNNKTYYYLNDHLGTPQVLQDESGKTLWSATYKPWGKIERQSSAQGVDNPLRFQGQYFDSETGLHYNRHRYYSPDQGRFITQDPIGLAGGLNSYRYVPNPVSWIDPLGLQCSECFSLSHAEKASLERYAAIEGPKRAAHEKLAGKGRSGTAGELMDLGEFMAGGTWQAMKGTAGFFSEHIIDTSSLLTGNLSINPNVPTAGQHFRRWVEGLGNSGTPSPFNHGQNDKELGIAMNIVSTFVPGMSFSKVDASEYLYTTQKHYSRIYPSNKQFKNSGKARFTVPYKYSSKEVPVTYVENKSERVFDLVAPDYKTDLPVKVLQEASKPNDDGKN